jgi:methionyl-tRNA formyltransferase
MSKPILFFGNEKLATGVKSDRPVLQALKTAGFDVIEVDTKRLNETGLASYGAEAAVLVAFGVIIPESTLSIFTKGIINVHPSLLPLYRGSTPIESAILDDANETGVSLMKLVPAMDAGPVYAQRSVQLSGHETKQELADLLSKIGGEMVVERLPAILAGSLQPSPQDDTKATYTKLITKQNGVLDWSKPAKQLECEVRAYAGWPRSQTTLNSTDVIITKAHADAGAGRPGSLSVQGKELSVYATDGRLIIDSLIPAGKPEMSAEAFLAGYQI